MNLLLIRHGETQGNQNKILQGQSEIALNENGIKQAQAVAKRLRSESFDIVFVSDLNRAKETAKYIVHYHQQTKVIFTSCLRERSFGIFEGKPWKTYERALQKSASNIFSFIPPKGESLQNLSQRVVDFHIKLSQEQAASNILIIGHRDWLTMLQLHILKLDVNHKNFIRQMPGNTAVSKVQIKSGRAVFALSNCTRHLE